MTTSSHQDHRFSRLLDDLDALLLEERFAINQEKFAYLEHLLNKKAIILSSLSDDLPTRHPYYCEKLKHLLDLEQENKASMQTQLQATQRALHGLEVQSVALKQQLQVLRAYAE